MSNASCPFSVDDLLKAQEDQMNITAIVGSCPNVCLLAWGNGNPDLSGIGMNISYILQSVLTLLCGPLFYLIFLLRHKLEFNKHTLKGMVFIQSTFVDASATLGIPVSFAAVMRIKDSPFHELNLLSHLVYMQYCSLVCISLVAFSILSEIGPYHRKWKRGCIMLIYGALEFILQWVQFGLRAHGLRRWAVGGARELMDACEFEVINPKPSDYAFWITLTVVVFAIWMVWDWSLSEGLKKWSHPLTVLLSLVWTGLSLKGLIYMQRVRNNTRAVVGVDFQDDQWGFGQLIAVFLWIPLCVMIVLHVIKVVYRNKYAINVQTVEEQELGLQGMSERPRHTATDGVPDYIPPVVADPPATARLWHNRSSTL